MRPGELFGIAAFANALGEPGSVESILPADSATKRMIRGWGYRNFHRASDGTGITDLAVEAGSRVLDKVGILAEDIDLIVLAIPDIAEYLYWDAAAATQARLGANNAEALLINQACCSGVVSFDHVAGKFSTHSSYNSALIIAANRVCEPYWDRVRTNTTVASDGACAAVAIRNFPRCCWLTTEIMTDGTYADFFRLEVGGTARPFGPSGEAVRILDRLDRLNKFFGSNTMAMGDFTESIGKRLVEVVDRACKSVALTRSDLKHIIHTADNIKAFSDLSRQLGIAIDCTNEDISMEYGHLGAADQIFGLEKKLSSGKLGKGDVVALTSVGSGMHWTCTLLQI